MNAGKPLVVSVAWSSALISGIGLFCRSFTIEAAVLSSWTTSVEVHWPASSLAVPKASEPSVGGTYGVAPVPVTAAASSAESPANGSAGGWPSAPRSTLPSVLRK